MAEITTWAIEEDTPPNDNGTDADDGNHPFDFGARCAGDRPCASFLGYHTPRHLTSPDAGPEWAGVFDVAGTSGVMDGYENQWSVLAWGLDAKEIPFVIVHEDQSSTNGVVNQPPTLDAISRNPEGPDAGSLREVLDSLVGLGNEVINGMVEELEGVEWDRGLAAGPAICPEGCLKNMVI